MNIFELVKLIKKRPGMYLESQSATELDYFIRGFVTAKKTECNDQKDMEAYYCFNRWVCKKTSIEANVSWRRAVVFVEPNEYYAFKRFFDLWEEWSSGDNK